MKEMAGEDVCLSVENHDELDIWQIIGILLKYKWLIIGITLISAIGVLIYVVLSLKLPSEESFLPNLYTSTALIFVSDDSANSMANAIASSGMGELVSLAGISSGGLNFAELANKILTGNTTMDFLNDEFGFTERYGIEAYEKTMTRNAIRKNVDLVVDEKTGTFTISFTAINPELARDVTVRLIDLLQERFEAIGMVQLIEEKQLLEDRIREVQVNLSILENDLQAFQVKYGVISADSLVTEQVTILAQLRSRLIQKEIELSTYNEFAKINDPVIQRLKAEQETLKKRIIMMESGDGSASGISYNILSQKEVSNISLKYSHLKRDITIQEGLYSVLLQRYELVKLEVEGQKPIFQILEMPEAPEIKSSPSRSTLCITVTIMGFFISIFLVFIINGIQNIKNDPAKLRKLFGTNK
jgi:tyrosine-protein kinase Etk/Wzc